MKAKKDDDINWRIIKACNWVLAICFIAQLWLIYHYATLPPKRDPHLDDGGGGNDAGEHHIDKGEPVERSGGLGAALRGLLYGGGELSELVFDLGDDVVGVHLVGAEEHGAFLEKALLGIVGHGSEANKPAPAGQSETEAEEVAA